MTAGRASFDIQVERDGRWTTEEMRETEGLARTVAKALIGKKQYSGVRIMKYWERSDGSFTETVIFTEQASVGTEKVTPSPIDAAPYCKKTREYYRQESRETINRLFRKYLEKTVMTPTELLHSYKALRKVQDIDTLFPAAVDRVATLQAQAAKEDSRVRRDEVYHAVNQMTKRAQKAEAMPNLPTLKGSDWQAVVNRVSAIAPPEDLDYYALVVLSRDLIQQNSWLAKLERLLELSSPGLADETLSILDGVYADLLGVPTALQEVLGPRNNLADAISAIADLWEGRLVATRDDLAQQLDSLNRLIADGRLQDTQRSLMEKLWKQLASGQPLQKSDPEREREAFRDVATRLFRPSTGLLGGPDTAAALTRRFVFLQEAGGKAGLHKSVEGIMTVMTDSLFGVTYLHQLAESELAQELAPTIEKCLKKLLLAGSIDELAPAKWPPTDRMLRVTRLFDAVGQGTIGTPTSRTELRDHLDELLVNYIESKKLIDKLDDPAAPLRKRAIRLLEFSAARVLPHGGKAHQLARDRIIGILRQPNFERAFIEGVTTPQEAEEALRSLHILLVRGGFRLKEAG